MAKSIAEKKEVYCEYKGVLMFIVPACLKLFRMTARYRDRELSELTISTIFVLLVVFGEFFLYSSKEI